MDQAAGRGAERLPAERDQRAARDDIDLGAGIEGHGQAPVEHEVPADREEAV